MGHSQSKASARGSKHHPQQTKSAQPFTYTPLAGPRNFRILHLARRRGEASVNHEDLELHASLVEASLDSVPEYFALSYTWGDPAPVGRIFINGRVLGITRNCADALQRMLKGKAERLIWVDSICINQGGYAEALQERSRQVGFMDEIYSRAIQVNVFLGTGDANTDVAVKAVKRLAYAYLPALLAKKSGVGVEMTRRKYEEIADEVLACTPEFPFGQLHGLFRLPWFRRTWVVQEVALARKVFFYCGDQLIAFDLLAAAADVTRLPYSKAAGVAQCWRVYLDPHHALAEFIRRRNQGEDVCKTLNFGTLHLLQTTMRFDATRPEDKIHGLYGCAKRLGLNWPVPDVTKSVAQVYTEVTLACLHEALSLDVLAMAEGSGAAEFEIPSWVPNFSKSMFDSNPAQPPKWGMVTKKNKLVSGDSQCQWLIMQGGRRLKVLGRRLDQVAAVSEPWRLDLRETVYGNVSMNSGQSFLSLLDCMPSWFAVVLQRNRANGRNTNASGNMEALQDLARLLVNGSPSLAASATHILEDLGKLINRLTITIEDLSTYEERMCPQIAHLNWKLVFRTFHKGYLGTGSYSSEPGDLVVVVCGMKVPCLIRPGPDGFTFVGAAFVDGILDGEFWNAGSNAENEWFELV